MSRVPRPRLLGRLLLAVGSGKYHAALVATAVLGLRCILRPFAGHADGHRPWWKNAGLVVQMVACSRSVLMPFQWFPTQWFLSTELD